MRSRLGGKSALVGILILTALSWISCRWVAPTPNIILISVDTLRADHLGCYGYPLKTSPNLDEFAKNAVLYSAAFAHSSETRPSCSSIMSGFYPHETTTVSNFDGLPGEVRTLAEILREAGYSTGAVVGNYALQASSGFAQGVDSFYDVTSHPEVVRNIPELTAPETTRDAIEWLRKRGKEKFFLWVHYQDPHGPYIPPPPFSQRFVEVHAADRQELKLNDTPSGDGGLPDYQRLGGTNDAGHYKSQYDGEIAFFDASFGRLLDELKRLGLLESSLIVFTADHGESLGEHNYFFAHGLYLYRELIRVPMIISWKGRKDIVQEPVQHIDVLSTILGVLGIDEVGARGRNILQAWFPARKIYSEIGEYRSIIDGRFSLIRNDETGTTSLFDMAIDPGQVTNLATKPEYSELTDELLESMDALSRDDLLKVRERNMQLDAGHEEKLRSLGYVK